MVSIIRSLPASYNDAGLRQVVTNADADASVIIRPRPAPQAHEIEVVTDVLTENDIDTIITNHNPEVLTTEQTVQAAKDTIKALATKADNHAARIALCFAAILESEAQAEDSDATFTRITSALNNAIVSNGYRTAVMTAFTAKTGLSFSFGNLGIVVITTKQAFNRFSAEFFTRWAFMVDLR